MSDSLEKAKQFKATIEAKIQGIVAEFAEGKISKGQFQILYERYSSRLDIANHALMTGTPEAITIAQGGPPTIAVRGASMGKAMGMIVYHNKSETVVETLGKFDVSAAKFFPTLKQINLALEQNRLVEQRTEKVDDRNWLVFFTGKFTTLVTLFRNEPAPVQMREIERLHHDFEKANNLLLQKHDIIADELAYPFVIFVEQWSAK